MAAALGGLKLKQGGRSGSVRSAGTSARTTLSGVVRQQAEQQSSPETSVADPTDTKKRGSKMLSFLSGSGQETLG